MPPMSWCLGESLVFASSFKLCQEGSEVLFFFVCNTSFRLKFVFLLCDQFLSYTFEIFKNLPSFHSSCFARRVSCFWMCQSAHAQTFLL